MRDQSGLVSQGGRFWAEKKWVHVRGLQTLQQNSWRVPDKGGTWGSNGSKGKGVKGKDKASISEGTVILDDRKKYREKRMGRKNLAGIKNRIQPYILSDN